jgi:hypothetical protein
MEVIRNSETVITSHIIPWRHNPEDHIPRFHRRDNFSPHGIEYKSGVRWVALLPSHQLFSISGGAKIIILCKINGKNEWLNGFERN